MSMGFLVCGVDAVFGLWCRWVFSLWCRCGFWPVVSMGFLGRRRAVFGHQVAKKAVVGKAKLTKCWAKLSKLGKILDETAKILDETVKILDETVKILDETVKILDEILQKRRRGFV